VANIIVQWFGMAQTTLIRTDGSIQVSWPAPGQGPRETRTWAEQHGVEITSDRLL